MTEVQEPNRKQPRTYFWGERVTARDAFAGILASVLILAMCVIAVIQVARGSGFEAPRYLTEVASLLVGYIIGSAAKGQS